MFVETVENTCTDDYSPEEIKVWASSIQNQDRWLRKLKTQYFLVAENDSEIIGFASLEHHTHLDMLYVHKDYQRMAIAQTLFDEIENEAIKNKATELTASVSITAKAFFEKNGFGILSIKKNKIDKVEIINYMMKKNL
jgi:putative acetyltransferase